MDSGNSGSIQSSSGGGGDEDYDSRAESSISSFLNHPNSHNTPITNPPPHHHPHHHNSPMFDPNSLLNFDTVWSHTQRSEADSTTQITIGPFATSSSSSPTVHFPPVMTENNNHNNTVTTTTTTRGTSQALGARGNTKKRTRASRRAPTTVLTTDTTNFRAMVQEFTGIPPPPFSSTSSSPFFKGRLDLFGAPSTTRSNPYLLRPFAQKFPPPPSVNYHQVENPIHHGFQQPLVQIQSDPNKKYPFIPNLSSDSRVKMGGGVLDELGLGHGLSNGPNLFSLDGGNGCNPTSWHGGGVGPNNGSYDYSERANNNGNLVNFSASSSDFHGEKGTENVVHRGEGMVEPWICSSD